LRKDAPWTPLLDVLSAPFELPQLLGRGLRAGLGDIFLEGFPVGLRLVAEALDPEDLGRSGVEARTLLSEIPVQTPMPGSSPAMPQSSEAANDDG